MVAIGQASHAWIAGQLARLWGNDRYGAPAPREEVCLAAEQHDIGMAEWDLRPSLNLGTGLPHSFLELPVETHIGLWTAAPARLLSQSRYAALLVSMHGTALAGRRDPAKLDPAERKLVADYLEGQRDLQHDLAERLGVSREELTRNQRLVWTWDSLSLALCLQWPTVALDQVPALEGCLPLKLTQIGVDRFSVDPWPFDAEEIEVHCEGRLLEQRYGTEGELHRALDEARSVALVFTLRSPRT